MLTKLITFLLLKKKEKEISKKRKKGSPKEKRKQDKESLSLLLSLLPFLNLYLSLLRIKAESFVIYIAVVAFLLSFDLTVYACQCPPPMVEYFYSD